MSTMARRMMVLAAIAALTAVGCGDDDGDDGTPIDGGADMNTPMVDMNTPMVDMGGDDEDMGGDVDMGGDEDMGADVDMFTETDMFVPDPGGGAATSAQIQAVIDAADGAVTLMIEDAVVSYTKLAFDDALDGAGFFVQAEQMGPALYVAVDPSTLSPEPSAGDVIDFQVTMKGEDGGIPFASAIDMYNQDSTGNDVSFLVQDVSAVDLVTDIDAYTSELISISGATIETGFGGAGGGFSAAQITTAGVTTASNDMRFRVPDVVLTGSALGAGCTVDIGPSPLWRFFGSAQPSAWDAADFAVTACPAPGVGDLVINEIGYTFAGSDDDVEFIEIHNPTTAAYDIGGCILADENGPTDADALTLPAGSIVGPSGYFVVAGSSSEITADATLPSALAFDSADAVSLTCAGGVQIDIVDWSTGTFPSMDDVSTQLNPGIDATGNDDLTNWCLTPAGNTYGTVSRVGTPGAENLPCPCPEASGVVINEVDYDDAGTDDHEFVELYNPTAAPVDITGWTLAFYSENDNRQDSSIVLTGSIPAGGYFVITGSGSDVTPSDAMMTSAFQNGTEAVALFDDVPGIGALVDVVVYEGNFGDPDLLDSTGTTTVGTIPTELNVSIGSDRGVGAEPDLNSLARVSDGCDRMNPATDWTFGAATPGAAN